MSLSRNCPLKSLLKNKKIKREAFSRNMLAHKNVIRTFFSDSSLPAGMTVEAGLVLPIFLFFLLSILYVFPILRLQSEVLAALHQEGNRITLQAYPHREEYPEGTVFLTQRYQISPFLLWMDFGNLNWVEQYYGHAWVGYDLAGHSGNNGGIGLGQYVFITETGTAYHQQLTCSYLDLSVKSVSRGEVSDRRNKAGGNYFACELCGEGDGNLCYLTDYGNRFHGSPVCRGLKRTVYRVILAAARQEGRHACPKCRIFSDTPDRS